MYSTRGWQISEKMERQAIRIIQMARQSGFVEAVQLELVNDQAVKPDLVNDKTSVGERPSKEELINSLKDSFHWFCEEGLRKLFMAKAPIRHSGRGLELVFISLELREPAHTDEDCQQLGLTYACPLYVKTRLLIKETGEIKEQDVYLADIPMITQNGTFIIDGVEETLIIDSLTNRSLDQSPINKGLDTLKSTAINRMSRISLETVTPSRLVDTRPLGTAIAEFFSESRELR